MTYMRTKRRAHGFTIVELLVVIVVIGILSLLVTNTIAGAQKRARDAQRATDVGHLRTLVLAYNAANGQLPRTQNYGEDNAGGYDSSAVGDWLPFLLNVSGGKPLPRDPINNELGDPSLNGAKYAYFYYCYHPAWDSWVPNPDHDTVRIGYRKEENDELVYTDVEVDSCQ